MGKAKKPVKVAGIEFDALISSEHKMEATVPEYATDKGFSVSDAITLKGETLSMTLFLTNTPVTWYKRHNKSGRVKEVYKKLEQLYYKAKPVKVVTTDKTYKNMAIETITINKSTENGYSLEIPISFRKIRTTESKTTKIPKKYGKSGKSKAPTGSANTSSGSSGSSSGGSSGGTSGSSGSAGGSSSSGGSSGSGSSGSGKSGSSGSKGSILFNLGKSSGIVK